MTLPPLPAYRDPRDYRQVVRGLRILAIARAIAFEFRTRMLAP